MISLRALLAGVVYVAAGALLLAWLEPGAAFGDELGVVPPLPPLPVSTLARASSPRSPLPLAPLPRPVGSRIDLRFVPVAQVVDLIYGDVLNTPYVLSPDVLADDRPVSFRFDRSHGDLGAVVDDFLHSLGFQVTLRDGVAYVSKADRAAADRETFVYAPMYRDADYLSRLLAPIVSDGRFTQNRAVAASEGAKESHDVPPSSAAGMVDQSADELVYVGKSSDVELLKRLLPQIDTPIGDVSVRAWVYEVTDTGQNNTAFELALSLLGGRVGASLNVGSVGAGDNAIRLSAGGLQAALSAFNSDSRFKVLTSPNLRVESGQSARLNVGESVPVVGSVSYPSSGGAPVQSVQYQDAGVIFQVKPTVKRDVIDLHLVEEISSFVNTTTGVNNSPTKQTRKVESSFGLSDGDVLLVGGLRQDESTRATSGLSFLPRWMAGHSGSKRETEILLLLQVRKI
ncbi:type II secretion system protein GspD [Trinickia soli]|uniref:type II secretion system protein GspD n=1 Tax=Trinickia soli TaxID=380675 RepID=UPI003FA3CA74